MNGPFLLIAPWWMPKLLTTAYVWALPALGIVFSKLGLHAPYVIETNFGANASIASVAIPVRDYLRIVEAVESHTALGSDGGGVTLTIEKLTGTQAPAGGQNMFKTSTFNLKSTINTPQRLVASQLTGLTAAQAAGQRVSPGDRIGLTFTGVLTALAGVGVTVVLLRERQQAVQTR